MVAWSFFSAGYYQLMKGIIMLPRKVFYAFPYANNESSYSTYTSGLNSPMILEPERQFETLTSDELNTMPYEEFVRIADIPLNQETPTHIDAEWRFANDENVNNIKRGIFIDRLAMSNEKDVIPRFLKMHAEIDIDELKTKIVQGLMVHYQNNTKSAQKNHTSLRKFYTELMRQKLSNNNADMIIRGYIDTHTANEILANIRQIDMQCKGIEAHLLLGLKHNLALKSQALEQIYVPSMIAMLKKYNRSDLDDMFFGITKMGYKQLRDSNSMKQIKAYIDYTSNKYTLLNAANNKDPYLGVAKKSLEELRRDMSIGLGY
ncbi:MAG: hypothetical protein P1U36_04620 [Legionellaceae bacterium]|nr:hypothetical protein [Legionellaceae bacterium]